MKSLIRLAVLATMICSGAVTASDPPKDSVATGSFQPIGPPQRTPVRVDAGRSCVVDVRQAYVVKGTLDGSFDIDYRILIVGPCGHPPGTFDEEWIARGRFAGTVNQIAASASFTYTARVVAGGDINGRMVLGQGLGGELDVLGNFGDGQLTYKGHVSVAEPE